MSGTRQVAIRLGTTGKAQVVADLDAIATTGDAAFNRLAKSAVKAGRDADAAMEFANKQASKLAALLPGLNPTKLDMAAGVRDGIGKSAESSAAVFEAAYAKMEARAVALRAAIDPAFGAQQRFDREMAEARTLISAGAISLDDYVAKLRQEQAALDAVSVGHGRAGNSAGAQRAAMQGLSYQQQDTFTQISMGTNVLQVFAIQGGQVAGQFSSLEGRAGDFARFMIGPWGLALTAAALVLGPLVGKLFDFSNAIEDGVDKLKKDATETENTRIAKERFARSAEGVAVSIREQATALQEAAKSERTAAERANILAKENYALEMSHRRVTAALLEQAIAQENVDRQRSQGTGQRGELGTLALTESSGRVAGLQKQLQNNQAALDQAAKNLNLSRVNLAEESAKTIATAEGRINKIYDDRIANLKADQREQAASGRVVGTVTRDRIAAINSERDAKLKAERDKQTASRETVRQYGREVTSSQASAIARAAGLQVNSADRSTARQQQLYDDWIAKGKPKENPVARPGTSAHERGNALDIQFQAGVTAKKIRDAFAAEGVRLTKVFAETGHWHVEWARTAAQRTAATDAAKETRDLAKANRELDSDLADVVNQFDPARAAADAYQATLAKIAALVSSGRLNPAEGGDLRLAAMHDRQTKREEARLAQFKVLFGAEDPLADTIASYNLERDLQLEARTEDYDRRKDGIRDLASYYRDAMTGGTKSIMDMFRQRGLDAIAEMLAKWTLGQGGASGGGLLNSVVKLFRGGSAIAGGSFAGADLNVGTVSAMGSTNLPKLASGTEYWSGGTALLGEHGPERAWLPKGTRVTPAGATGRIDGAGMRGGDKHYYFSGNLMTPEFWAQIQAGDDCAAVRGAAGGSQMAQREVSRQQSRVLA